MTPYREIFVHLAKNKIRYLVAGGFAVNFHQVQRATVDLDLIVHLEKENILAFVKMMTGLGFIPRVPVDPEQFADDKERNRWILEKGLMVFSFIHPDNSFEVVDVFAQEPEPFLDLFQRRLDVKAFGIVIPVLGKKDLIEMKKRAGREKDLFDARLLEKIK